MNSKFIIFFMAQKLLFAHVVTSWNLHSSYQTFGISWNDFEAKWNQKMGYRVENYMNFFFSSFLDGS